MTYAKELRALLEKATPSGKWREGQIGNVTLYGPDNAGEHSGRIATFLRSRRADLTLIVAAVNALPGLLDELDRLRGALEFYADEGNSYARGGVCWADDGVKARAALKGSE